MVKDTCARFVINAAKERGRLDLGTDGFFGDLFASEVPKGALDDLFVEPHCVYSVLLKHEGFEDDEDGKKWNALPAEQKVGACFLAKQLSTSPFADRQFDCVWVSLASGLVVG